MKYNYNLPTRKNQVYRLQTPKFRQYFPKKPRKKNASYFYIINIKKRALKSSKFYSTFNPIFLYFLKLLLKFSKINLKKSRRTRIRNIFVFFF